MADAIALDDETSPERMYHPFDPEKFLELSRYHDENLLVKVMEKGKKLKVETGTSAIAEYCKRRLSLLPPEHKRFEYPHVYKVGLSQKLLNLRNDLIHHYRQEIEGGGP